ncbi:MAG: coproporphyrinogen III oxidase family protein [Turicibacter sp.]|nr:coproporphyrinogen III oxidase family protein [Turicibacter sp.]
MDTFLPHNKIEKIVGGIIRRQVNSYLRFDPSGACQVPILRDTSKPIMMYIHIPFCERLCTYCSFHKVVMNEDLARDYFHALNREILMYAEKGYKFSTVYFGGGTPTVLMPELLATIGLLKQQFEISEISLETNPNHLDEEHIRPLQEIGVNRLSVGVQSFDDEILKKTGRFGVYGSGAEIVERIERYCKDFPTFNVDMMFNMPVQSEESLRRDLEIIRGLGINQITYYPLMLSAATRKTIEKTMGDVDSRRGRHFYGIISEQLAEDFKGATAWCFNRKDTAAALVDEYVINYEDYAGVGSGSIGYINGSIYANTFNIEDYIKLAAEGKFPVIARRDCNVREQYLYIFLMQFFGLSLDLGHLRRERGIFALVWLSPVIAFFMLVGGIGILPRKWVLHLRDRYYWVIMMREFFTAVNNFREYCRGRG